MILSGELPPGSVLLQAEMARRLGVRRTPMREVERRRVPAGRDEAGLGVLRAVLGAAHPVVAGAADAAQVSQSRGPRVSATRPMLLSSSR